MHVGAGTGEEEGGGGERVESEGCYGEGRDVDGGEERVGGAVDLRNEGTRTRSKVSSTVPTLLQSLLYRESEECGKI